jgi:hypothetical protein
MEEDDDDDYLINGTIFEKKDRVIENKMCFDFL